MKNQWVILDTTLFKATDWMRIQIKEIYDEGDYLIEALEKDGNWLLLAKKQNLGEAKLCMREIFNQLKE